MAVSTVVRKKTCDIYVCKKIKQVGIAEVNNAIDWIQNNNTAQERADLEAAFQSRDTYLIGIWWKTKFEQYMDLAHRPTCDAFWTDDSLTEAEVVAIFDESSTLGCF